MLPFVVEFMAGTYSKGQHCLFFKLLKLPFRSTTLFKVNESGHIDFSKGLFSLITLQNSGFSDLYYYRRFCTDIDALLFCVVLFFLKNT